MRRHQGEQRVFARFLNTVQTDYSQGSTTFILPSASNLFKSEHCSSTSANIRLPRLAGRSWMGRRKTGRPSKKVISAHFQSDTDDVPNICADRRTMESCTESGEELRERAAKKDVQLELNEIVCWLANKTNENRVKLLRTGNVVPSPGLTSRFE